MGIELNNDQIYAIYELDHWWNTQMKQTFQISGSAGTGKAIPLDTIIPTPDGDKKVEDLSIGSYVFNRYGKPVKILGIYDQGYKDVYEVTFDDERTALCCEDHLWSYYDISNRLKTKSLKDMMNGELQYADKRYQYAVPLAKAVYYDTKRFRITPYRMGNKIIKEKMDRIPKDYFFGDEEQRWDLVKGLFDMSGDIFKVRAKVHLQFRSEIFSLVIDVRDLLNSLGVKAFIKEIKEEERPVRILSDGMGNMPTHMYSGVKRKYILEVSVPNKQKPKFFELSSNLQVAEEFAEKVRDKEVFGKIYIKQITDLKYKAHMACLYVEDEEHLFLMNNYIPTHNTTLIRYFIDRLGLTYDNVLFVAYMGKAASQMARNGLPAKTIHSAIYDYKEKYARDENNKIIIKSNGKPKMVPYFALKDHLNKKIKLIVVDEGSQVETKMAEDLLSFGIPVIVLGDLNQLPPVFGDSYFLRSPDVILRQIMRQAENNPIIWLANQVLAGNRLCIGVYGNSAVISKKDITEFHFRKSDIILTGTNRLRYNINNYCREEIKNIKRLEYPHIGEKIICRKNNWSQCIGDNIFLTNGTTGFVDNIYKESFNKKTMRMDFRPDFTNKVFHNITFDYQHMYAIPGNEEEENPFGYFYDKMEYAYAITVHSSQGSQWGNVLYLHEDFMNNPEDKKRFLYTAITRASEALTIVL